MTLRSHGYAGQVSAGARALFLGIDSMRLPGREIRYELQPRRNVFDAFRSAARDRKTLRLVVEISEGPVARALRSLCVAQYAHFDIDRPRAADRSTCFSLQLRADCSSCTLADLVENARVRSRRPRTGDLGVSAPGGALSRRQPLSSGAGMAAPVHPHHRRPCAWLRSWIALAMRSCRPGSHP